MPDARWGSETPSRRRYFYAGASRSREIGHSQFSITMDIYSHVLPALGAEAAEKMNAAVA